MCNRPYGTSMKIQTKLVLGASTLIIASLIFTSSTLGYISTTQSTLALEESSSKTLRAIRNSTSVQLNNYFEQISQQIQTLAKSSTVMGSVNRFRFSYYKFGMTATKSPEENIQRQKLKAYYAEDFSSAYMAKNPGTDKNIAAIVDQLDANSVALQYEFIANNQHSLNEKHQLSMGENLTSYSVAHKDLHAEMTDFLNRFGYYDIFIVDADKGHVMYSVTKGIDYATSLIDGPYANTGLGIAFQEAKKITLDSPQAVYLSDFSAYLPSFNAPASFMSTPIFAGTKKTAILIFKMPMGKINNIMAQNQQWNENGLGDTGETFLVGQDKTLRSQSRSLLENPEAYLSALKLSGVDQPTLQRIEKQNTSIGLHQLDNPAVERGLQGEKATIHYQKFHGKEVISSFMPIQVLNNHWLIMSEIDYKEAIQAAEDLTHELIYSSIITAAIAIAASIVATLLFAKSIASPIHKTVAIMHNIADGEGDLTARLDENRSDELGEIALWFNTFSARIQSLIINIKQESIQLEKTSQHMKSISSDNAEGALQQQQTTEKVTQSMNEVNASSQSVADNAITAEQAANSVNSAAINGAKTMTQTKDSILKVADSVAQATDTINQLEETSESIGSVVGVINSIAEQTNLLALNAAIEAARAGEQGRGFAVVADEVRALASRTQESTHEINSIIEKLQSNSNAAVEAMKIGHNTVHASIKESEGATTALETIKNEIINITDINKHISESAQIQSTASFEAKNLIEEVNTISKHNQESAASVNDNSQTIANITNNLSNLIKQFKTE